MKYDEPYIKEFLTQDGCSVADYYIVGGLIMYLSELDGELTPMALVIEEDDLLEACIDYLIEKGVKQFNSDTEYKSWLNDKVR